MNCNMNTEYHYSKDYRGHLLCRFILTLCAVSVSMYVEAVIAYPGIIDFKQPDGSSIKVRMMGDEFNHWAETEDGYSLLYDDDGYLTLARYDDDGNLVPSDLRISSHNAQSVQLMGVKRTVGKHAQFSEAQRAEATRFMQYARGTLRNADISFVNKPKSAVTGKKKFLLLLMDFPDKPITFNKSAFDPFLNSKGYRKDGNNGSVRDYYLENSFGQLDLTWDVAGVYRAAHASRYYGDESSFAAAELLVEGLEQAAAQYDLSDYDNDGDGIVDCVHMIYAGYGEEAGAGSDCIWAHSVSVPLGSGYICRYDGVQVNSYSCSPELMGNSGNSMTKIGVLCHEVGHVLGASDFYDTDYGVNGEYPGSGSWDLMGSGNWNGDGGCPAHSNPYIKIYDYQWASPINVTQAGSYSLTAKSADGFIRIDSKTSGEYFLLECRSKSGFDSDVPGHGLMIWRASENLSRSASGKINASHKQQFYPVAANATSAIPTSSPKSYGDPDKDSAPFPGSKNVKSFTDETVPSMKSWSGAATELPITEITENVSSKSVSFNIAGGGQSGDISNQSTMSASATSNTSIRITWNCQITGTKVLLAYNSSGEFPELSQDVYSAGGILPDGESKVLYVGNSTTFVHGGLTKNTNCRYCLYLWNTQSKKWDKGSACQATTTNIDVGNITGGDIHPNSIRISWDLQDKNLVTLLVFNRTGTFPELEQKFGYTPGEILKDGLTEVLHMGVADYFVHSNLEENSEYHYALYAWSDKKQKWEFAEDYTFWTCSSSGGGLTVTEKDAVSVSLTWNNPDGATMLLLANQTCRFPQLLDQYYGIGYLMDDGVTTPIYMGTGNSVRHIGLVKGSTYYYQLYTWHQKSKQWLFVDMATVTTELKAAGEIVFQENFDAATFPTGWSQELIRGYYDAWQVKTPYNYMPSTQMVFNGGTQYKYLEGRLILPAMAMGKNPNAVLELDYRSAVNRLEVQYRASADENWTTVKSLDKTYDGPPSIDVADTQTHTSIPLPDLSDTYQIAFLAEYSQASATNYSVYNIATIDNLVIYCDLDFYIGTERPVAVGNDWANIPCNVSDKNGIVIERGISYSDDSETWYDIVLENPDEDNICPIQGLNLSTVYYYRTYAKTAAETYYGDILSFETLPFEKGHGLSPDPFLIENEEDWTAFADYISSGHDCQGQFFKLNACISNAVCVKGHFKGVLDGNGMTVSASSGTVWTDGLFSKLGKGGVIRHLKTSTGSIVNENHGTISCCNVVSDGSDIHVSGTFGFIANSNFADILSCNVSAGGLLSDGIAGGICGHNEGVIIGCAFDGTICSSGGNVGGIVAENIWADCRDGRKTSVLYCRNTGSITVSEDARSAVDAGGICGNNSGTVYGCVNDADIISVPSAGSGVFANRLGGICGFSGEDDADISYCINNGDITASANADESAGGLVGKTQYGYLGYCVSAGNVISQNGQMSVEDFVGNLLLSEYSHLHHMSTGDYSGGTSVSEEAMNKIYDIAHDNVYAYAAPIEVINDMEYCIHGMALGDDVVTCALEWKPVSNADAKWTRVFQHAGEWMSVRLTTLESGKLYCYRTVAVDVQGQSHYSQERLFAAPFSESGTIEDPILINGMNELEVMRQLSIQGETFKDKVLKMTADIDMGCGSGRKWDPMYKSRRTAFEGTFDGGGHILSNMYIVSTAPAVGLIGYAGCCSIHDLYIANTYIVSQAKYVAGYRSGVAGVIGVFIPEIQPSTNPFVPVERCAVTGEISGSIPMGGITGGVSVPNGTRVTDCFVRAEMTHFGVDDVRIGGIMASGNPYYCYFVGNLAAPNAVNPRLDAATTVIWGSNNVISYYEENDNGLSSQTGTKLTSAEMKNGRLLGIFTIRQNGVWQADNSTDPMNDGYPVISSIWNNRTGDDFNWHLVAHGDINDDGNVNIGDYVTLVNHILGEPCNKFVVKVADLNNDGEIDSGDCVSMMNYILYGSFSSGHSADYSMAFRKGFVGLAADGFDLHCGDEQRVTVRIESDFKNFSAFQLDFELPEGIVLESVGLSDDLFEGRDHRLSVREIEHGKWRVLCLSPTNSEFAPNSGNLLQLHVRAEENAASGDVAILMTGGGFADANACVKHVEDSSIPISISGATDLKYIEDAGMMENGRYSLQGFPIDDAGEYRGIVVERGKKIVVQ